MLHEDVVGRIRAILLDGEIPPGARIPERELCERLQISRTPLREALKVLAAEGLVQLLPHRGSRAAKLTDKDMRDLFEVCQGLEALAGELAAGASPAPRSMGFLQRTRPLFRIVTSAHC